MEEAEQHHLMEEAEEHHLTEEREEHHLMEEAGEADLIPWATETRTENGYLHDTQPACIYDAKSCSLQPTQDDPSTRACCTPSLDFSPPR